MSTSNSFKVITLASNQKGFLERNDNLMRYYADIRDYDLLSEEETMSLLKDYKKAKGIEKDKIRDKIFNHNARLVISFARQYCTTNDNLNDLIEEGNVGLLIAIDKFDAKKESSFQKCALFYIRREINLFKMNYSDMVYKTNHSKTDNLARNITSQFLQKEGRVPTTQELLEEYNKASSEQKQVTDHKDFVNVEYVYIDSLFGQTDDFTDCQSYIDFATATASSNDYMKTIENDSNNSQLESLMECLSSKEKLAIRMMYGLETGFDESLNSIGTTLGCSSERARQICVETINKMQKSQAFVTR